MRDDTRGRISARFSSKRIVSALSRTRRNPCLPDHTLKTESFPKRKHTTKCMCRGAQALNNTRFARVRFRRTNMMVQVRTAVVEGSLVFRSDFTIIIDSFVGSAFHVVSEWSSLSVYTTTTNISRTCDCCCFRCNANREAQYDSALLIKHCNQCTGCGRGKCLYDCY